MYTVLNFSMAFILIVGGAGRAYTIAVTTVYIHNLTICVIVRIFYIANNNSRK